jgi:hypothetical protein
MAFAKRRLYATTMVVILLTLIMGLYLWGLDLMLDRLVSGHATVRRIVMSAHSSTSASIFC